MLITDAITIPIKPIINKLPILVKSVLVVYPAIAITANNATELKNTLKIEPNSYTIKMKLKLIPLIAEYAKNKPIKVGYDKRLKPKDINITNPIGANITTHAKMLSLNPPSGVSTNSMRTKSGTNAKSIDDKVVMINAKVIQENTERNKLLVLTIVAS